MHRTRRYRRRGGPRLFRERIEHHRSRQIVEGHIEARAGLDELLDFRVRLRSGEVGVQLNEHNFRNWQPQRTRNLAGDELGYQRFRALACAAEFEYVHAIVIRLHDGGKRAAFVQGRDVSSGAHSSHTAILAKCIHS